MDHDAEHMLARMNMYVATMRQPLDRVEFLAEMQRATADGLRTAVDAARRHGHTWTNLSTATGLQRETIHRQFHGGGPVVVVRPTHGKALPPGSLRLPDGWVQDSLFDMLEPAT